MKLPQSRIDNIVVQEFADEVLIYDLLTNQAFCLNETSAIVFNACNGKTKVSEVKQKSQLTDEMIFLALDQLKRAELLEKETDYVSPFEGMTRREVIKRVGLASMIALPVISTVIAPTAAFAQSGAISFTCSNPGAANSQFCASSPTDCNTQAKTFCATCGATASTSGLCSANPAPNTITCTCGGACSNPGAATSQFCSTLASACSQATTLCANCAATGSPVGLCSANPPGGATLTCTCL